MLSMILIVGLASCSKKSSSKNASRATGWNVDGKKASGAKKQIAGPGLIFVEGGTFTMGKVEDDVQLAHVVEQLVQDLHVVVNRLQYDEFIVLRTYQTYKEQRRVSLVHNFLTLVLDKVAHLLGTGQNLRSDLTNDALLLLLVGLLIVELGQTDLALTAH